MSGAFFANLTNYRLKCLRDVRSEGTELLVAFRSASSREHRASLHFALGTLNTGEKRSAEPSEATLEFFVHVERMRGASRVPLPGVFSLV